MDQKAMFMKYWAKEAAATRKVLSRIPEGSTYRPDPKSRTARELAWLITNEESALGEGLEKGVLEWNETPAPATMKAVLERYDRQHDETTKRLNAVDPSRFEQNVPFMFQGKQVMNDPGTRTHGDSCSTSSTIEARSRRISGRWDRPCRRSTARAPTNRCRTAGAGGWGPEAGGGVASSPWPLAVASRATARSRRASCGWATRKRGSRAPRRSARSRHTLRRTRGRPRHWFPRF